MKSTPIRFTALLLVLLSLCLRSRASSPDDEMQNAKRWKKGFVVTLGGDTVQGRIKVPDYLDVYYDYQRMVEFRGPSRLAQYSPHDLKSFSYSDEGDELVTLQSVSSPEGDGRVFLRVYGSGTCRVYELMVTESRGNGGAMSTEVLEHASLLPIDKKYIQIRGSEFYPMHRVGFKKRMKEVFSSCPRILAGLDSGEYTYDKWQALVRDYNEIVPQ